MIVSGELRDGKLTLRAESTQDATMVRNGLSGKNTFINIAPYGNRIEITLMGNGIIFRKSNNNALTYEELKSIIKKIQMFGKIESFYAKRILKDAREALNRQLTMFFRTTVTPQLEIGFAYNWISLEFKTSNFDNIFNAIKTHLAENCPPTIKAFSNNSDSISIHNYAMSGIYLPRKIHEGIADILIKDKIISPEDKDLLITKSIAFGVKSVSFMEARQASDHADETFSINNLEQYSHNLGDINFIKEMFTIAEKLANTGTFTELDEEDLQQLSKISEEDAYIESFSLSQTLYECFHGIAHNFSKEILALKAS